MALTGICREADAANRVVKYASQVDKCIDECIAEHSEPLWHARRNEIVSTPHYQAVALMTVAAQVLLEAV